jgi:4-phospho-D-threonate 3-dehydrogenase / 4-phospho-D-erythronate 3-dehydrogenase
VSESTDANLETLPKIGITMGDAAGIGPEIVLRAIRDENVRRICLPVIIGDAGFLRKTAVQMDLDIDFVEFENDLTPSAGNNSAIIYNLANLTDDFPVGVESAVAGKASAEYIEAAVALWRDGRIDAVTTAPINKKSLHLGGYDFPGHTEFLAALTGTKDFAMSFFAGRLRIVLLSTHLSLREAIGLVRKEKLVELIRFTDRELQKLLGRRVRIAVAGLNPHASESGMFGTEEAAEIVPAVETCRTDFGIDASGAFSPDTIFLRAFRGEFDAVVACYHDQATIAVKCLSFGESVNVTLGLPLIRTSVDHGTAYDIAGKFVADGSSLRTAVELAAELSAIRQA